MYSVEISDEITTVGGVRSAVVESSDFHHCASYPGLAAFLRQAINRGAKRLRMRLLTTKNDPVALKWTKGNRVYVSDGGARYESKDYGWVDLESGGFVSSDRGVPADVAELLSALSENPAKAASAYGRAMSECCFCDKSLDDERSIEAGWGPNCARRYGLPWGDEGETTKRRAKRTRKAVNLG